jgi:hypothetical protein
MLRALRELLGESSTSSWMDDFTSYTYLNQAAREFVQRTECLRTEQTITTVSSQASYDLNADFLQLYLMDSSNTPFVKFYNGTSYSWCYYKDIQDVYLANNTTGVSIPSNFTITDNPTLPTRLSSTATSSGALSGGQCTLTDTTALFTTTGKLSAGDQVHNVTDGSDGVVLSITSATVCVTALFGGSGNNWDSSDAYVIQPQARLRLTLDPMPTTAGYIVTVPYVQIPNPVYSDYGRWRIPDAACIHIVQYAAWLYKYRDREIQFGDQLYKWFEMGVRKWGARTNETLRPKNQMRVNFMGRR